MVVLQILLSVLEETPLYDLNTYILPVNIRENYASESEVDCMHTVKVVLPKVWEIFFSTTNAV